MPRRSIWKGNFVDAFLLRMKKKRDLFNRKIWSRRSSIFLEFIDCSVQIHNGKTLARCKITKGNVVINLESLLLHGNQDLREKILDQEEKGGKSKV